ncbi:hypothetical protein LOD99_8084 [Oopsacas minuta]|uniref:L-fucose mutarotase n=1 Tax=Oopsacas minuta TaxID=111878 RepID=A0AAV7JHR9_9METZ|nr:hypothetical protein LOD99_8084 [Oopsacas minuta]
MPLKLIPRVLSPELIYVLARMGHGDTIVFGDANFPSTSVSKAGPEIVRADGMDIPTLLKATLKLFPLDTYVAAPVGLMQIVPGDIEKGLKTPVWDDYRKIVKEAEGVEVNFEKIERFDFYKRAKNAFAIVATGEQALYGNIILTKGAIPPDA